MRNDVSFPPVGPDASKQLERLRVQLMLKRAIDMVGAAVGLLILWPLLIVIAIVVRLDSPGPALFQQQRVGRQGRLFTISKFRTMLVNADAVLGEMLDHDPALRAEYMLHRKLKRDPRLTTAGRFLRKTSLDELPQLFNVVIGDMSLVGPRPYFAEELLEYSAVAQEDILAMAPGITGLWQVSGRNELSLDERVALEVRYVRQWSLLLDIKLLVMTIPAIFSKRGAY